MQNAIKKHQEEFNQLCLKLEEDINAGQENYQPVNQDVIRKAVSDVVEFSEAKQNARKVLAERAASNIQKSQGSLTLS